MKRDAPAIVADGYGRLRRASEFHAARARFLARALDDRRAEIRGATFWRRVTIRWEIRRWVDAEMEKAFPSGALYARGPLA